MATTREDEDERFPYSMLVFDAGSCAQVGRLKFVTKEQRDRVADALADTFHTVNRFDRGEYVHPRLRPRTR